MTESDPLIQVDSEAFFEGVAEMRSHLERNIHDPARRRTRLQRIARDLLKPRSARVLAAWLGQASQRAVGAGASGVWVRGEGKDPSGWQPYHRTGSAGVGPTPEQLASLSGSEPKGTLGEGLLVPVPGLDGLTAALWLQGGEPLNPDSLGLMQAIAGTAGMILAQALRVEALARDPATGLLSTASFIDQAGAELRQPPGGGLLLAIVALRLLGAGGLSRLDPAARGVFGPGTPLTAGGGRSGQDLFAIPAVVTLLTGEGEIRSGVAELAQRAGDQPWVAAFAFTPEPIDDLTSLMEKLSAALDVAETGQLVRVKLG